MIKVSVSFEQVAALAEASMTVNSKEAQKVIFDLFNQSLGFGQIPVAAPEDLELEKQFAVMSSESLFSLMIR